MPKPPDYILTIRALPSDVPAPIRLRAVLKRLLRTFEFRCVRAIEIESGERLDAPDVTPGHQAETPAA